jgi:hypothetical protein
MPFRWQFCLDFLSVVVISQGVQEIGMDARGGYQGSSITKQRLTKTLLGQNNFRGHDNQQVDLPDVRAFACVKINDILETINRPDMLLLELSAEACWKCCTLAAIRAIYSRPQKGQRMAFQAPWFSLPPCHASINPCR